jgi:hypothetical protein
MAAQRLTVKVTAGQPGRTGPPSLACFIAFLPAYAATNRVRLRDATMVESADAPASVARQSRYA